MKCDKCNDTGSICLACDQAIDDCECFEDQEPCACPECSSLAAKFGQPPTLTAQQIADLAAGTLFTITRTDGTTEAVDAADIYAEEEPE